MLVGSFWVGMFGPWSLFWRTKKLKVRRCQSLREKKCSENMPFDKGFVRRPYSIEEYKSMGAWQIQDETFRWFYEIENFWVPKQPSIDRAEEVLVPN